MFGASERNGGPYDVWHYYHRPGWTRTASITQRIAQVETPEPSRWLPRYDNLIIIPHRAGRSELRTGYE